MTNRKHLNKRCPKGKICNPVSGRCVSKKGKIGKRLMATSKSSIKGLITTSDWFMIKKKGCSYCDKAKDLLKSKRIKFYYRTLTDKNKGTIFKITDPLTKKYRYFPMIFHKGKFIGGYKELSKRLK